MLSNYFKVAWRYLLRDKVISLISVTSLSLGIGCAILVFLVLQNEQGRDDFHRKGHRIFRLHLTNEAGTEWWEQTSALVPPELAAEMAESFPEIEAVLRWGRGWGRLRREDFTARFLDMAYVDSTLFSVMSFDIIHGDRSPLSTPNEVVLTESTALRFAENGNISRLIGERFTFFTSLNKLHEVTCTAIVRDPIYRSTLQFTGFLPLDLSSDYNDWIEEPLLTFILLRDPKDLSIVEQGLPDLARRVFATQTEKLRLAGKWSLQESPYSLHTMPLTEMHKIDLPGDQLHVIDDTTLWIVGVLGGLVLVVGCLNFVILSLGRAVYRSKEIGLRKVSGALRHHVISQHVIEATLLCGISAITGAALADYLMPRTAALFSIPNYVLEWSHSPSLLTFLFLLPLVVAILAGFYPAYSLSKVEPVAAMKGERATSRKGRFTTILVVIQFAATIFLLASTQILLGQIRYGQTLDRGYDPSTLFVIDPNSLDHERLYRRYRTAVMGLPGVLNVAGSSTTVGEGAQYHRMQEPEMHVFHASVTPEFVSTFGLTLVEGKLLKENGPVDEVLVNQQMVEAMGWEDPIGQTVPIKLGEVDHPTVIGVLEDFIYLHARAPVFPFVVHQNPSDQTERVWVRLDPLHVGTLLPKLNAIWREVAPDPPSTLHLLSEDVESMDEDQQRLIEPLGYGASVFGAVISCLGAFGLSLHMFGLRRKEVVVRKVIGASVLSVFALLCRGLLFLAAVGCVMGSVGSYYVVTWILRDHSNRVPIGTVDFLLPSLGLIALAFLSIVYHTLRTACVEPTKELKHE